MEGVIKIEDWNVPFPIQQISTENEMSTCLLHVKNEPLQETIIVKTEIPENFSNWEAQEFQKDPLKIEPDVHEEQKNYKCDICHLNFNNLQNLKIHTNIHQLNIKFETRN